MVTIQSSIVLPIYNNQEFIPDLMECCQYLSDNLTGGSEFIFVVDGSPDDSLNRLKEALPSQKFVSKLIVLSKNFGSFSAIRTGLQNARGQHLFFIAADLQEPPSFILDASKVFQKNEADIVIGKRKDRDDGMFNDFSSNLFWTVYRKIIPNVPKGGVDLFACTAQVRDSLLTLNESNTSLVGQLYWIGYRKRELEYSRNPRKSGKSGWTFKKKMKYLKDSIFSFTDFPLKFLLTLGTFGCGFSVLAALLLTYLRLINEIVVPGYAAIMITIMFFGSLNLIGLGIIGEYLHRAFDNTKNRPQSIIQEVLAFEGAEK